MPEEPIPLDALNFLQRLGMGKLIEQIHAESMRGMNEVVATKKKAKVVIELELVPPKEKGAPENFVHILENVKLLLPKSDARGAYAYVGEDSLIYGTDPRQAPLTTFRVVENGAIEVRTPDEGTTEVREASE